MVSFNQKVYIVWLVRELLFSCENGCEYEPALNIVYFNLVNFIDVGRQKAIQQEVIVTEGY